MFDEQCEEFALDPAARAVGPMRVAGAQEPPWGTPPTRESCGRVKWPDASLVSLVSLGLFPFEQGPQADSYPSRSAVEWKIKT